MDNWSVPATTGNGRVPRRLPRTLFVDDAARLLGVSRRTVYYRIADGQLATVRTRGGSRRVTLESIEALLRQDAGAARPRRPVKGPGADV